MLINKKKIIIFLVMMLLAISTYSYGTSKGVITGETVKLRDGASLESKLVMLLSVNDQVEVLGQEGEWYNVKYKDKVGYVYKDYLKVNKVDEQENQNSSANNNSETENPEQTEVNNGNNQSDKLENNNNMVDNNTKDEITVPSEKVIVDESKITLLPLINSSTIAVIKKDTKVTVTEYKNGWAYIISSVASGWIRKERLQDQVISTADEEEKQTENKEDDTTESKDKVMNKTAYVNVNSVRVRKSATTDSEIVDSLVKNNQVIIIGEENDWYKVKVDGKEGYIVKKYLSDKEVEVTNRSTNTERTAKKTELNTVETNNSENNSNTVNSNSNGNENNSSSTSSVKGSSIVEYANKFLNSKYVAGGSTPSTGFDCSGFTYYVYKHFGYSLNRSSAGQANNGVEVSKSNLQLGDLVLFSQGSKKIGHVGIYIGGNSFIHAANKDKGVIITSLNDSYYKARYVTARRIIN